MLSGGLSCPLQTNGFQAPFSGQQHYSTQEQAPTQPQIAAVSQAPVPHHQALWQKRRQTGYINSTQAPAVPGQFSNQQSPVPGPGISFPPLINGVQASFLELPGSGIFLPPPANWVQEVFASQQLPTFNNGQHFPPQASTLEGPGPFQHFNMQGYGTSQTLTFLPPHQPLPVFIQPVPSQLGVGIARYPEHKFLPSVDPSGGSIEAAVPSADKQANKFVPWAGAMTPSIQVAFPPADDSKNGFVAWTEPDIPSGQEEAAALASLIAQSEIVDRRNIKRSARNGDPEVPERDWIGKRSASSESPAGDLAGTVQGDKIERPITPYGVSSSMGKGGKSG